jgi:hypothetical protein
MNPISFTPEMLSFYQDGQKQRRRLVLLKDRIKQSSTRDEYPHFYIYSLPGLGKTYTINKAMEEESLNFEMLSGNLSIWAFGVTLATINFLKPADEEVVILVDDCDEILKTTSNINIMKNILEGSKSFHYQKNLNMMGQLDSLQQQALQAHMTEGQMGFKVPMDKFIFVFTSNEKLPLYGDISSQRTMDLFAIRDRVRPIDFDLQPMVQWGWIADVALNTEAINTKCPQGVVEEACRFMYDNWFKLKTHSIRTIKMMCEDYVKNIDSYQFIWEMEYLK